MLSQEELENQVSELKAQVNQLQTIIAQLNTSITQHIGLDYGAVQQSAPHPNQQVSTVTFGSGDMRLDTHGIQLASHRSNTGDISLSFTDEFVENPDEHYPRVQIYGSTFNNAEMAQMALNVLGTYAFSSITYDLSDKAPTLKLSVGSDNGTARMWLKANATRQWFYIEAAPFGLAETATDYTGTGDAYLWYNSANDYFRATEDGKTYSLAMAGTDSEVTIEASGKASINHERFAAIKANSGTTDDLDTLGDSFSSSDVGRIITLRPKSGHTITVRDFSVNSGNMHLAGAVNFVMDSEYDTISFIINSAGELLELCRSNNA